MDKRLLKHVDLLLFFMVYFLEFHKKSVNKIASGTGLRRSKLILHLCMGIV